MTDGGEKARFGSARGFSLIARKRKRLLGFNATCNITPDALNFRSTIAANGDLSPGYPAYTVIRFNLFIVHPGPVGLDGNDTAVTNRQLCCATDQNLTRLARKLTERIVCVSDPTRTVTPDDDIALCLQQAARSLFCFAYLPDAVRKLFDLVFQHALPVFGCAISCVDECRQDAGDQSAGQSKTKLAIWKPAPCMVTASRGSQSEVSTARDRRPFGAGNVANLFSINRVRAVRVNVVNALLMARFVRGRATTRRGENRPQVRDRKGLREMDMADGIDCIQIGESRATRNTR